MTTTIFEGARTAEMTIAFIEKIGVEDTEWFIEYEPEMFDYPFEAWKVEEFVQVFDTVDEMLDYYDLETLDEADNELCVYYDKGLNHVIVFE